ncbi:MAG: VIT1/CCC1 transporter family protein [Phycisphaerae bacterium]
MNEELRRRLIEAQRNEITEHEVYQRLSRRQKDGHNRDVLRRIGDEEKRHYDFLAEHTGATPPPRRLKVWKFDLIARLLGVTFAIKLMEAGEQDAQDNYTDAAADVPGLAEIAREEDEHEHALTQMIDEDRLRYVGSVVLGLSDALVELLGALAGLTLALRDSRLIAVVGLITGIAAAMSMAASEYLSTRHERDDTDEKPKSPVRAALYTGLAYILTVAVLVAPFLLLSQPVVALAVAVASVLIIISAFTYYVSVAQELPFARRFAEMAGLSLGVAAVSFGIGYLVRLGLGVDV